MPFKIFNYINRVAVSLFIIVLVDILFLDRKLQEVLPGNVSSIAFYYAIFGFPHIIASYIGYLNKDYFAFYKAELAKHFLINFLIIVSFLLFFPKLFLYFFIAYTLYHVAWQQVGIARKFFSNQKMYRLWSLTGVLSAIIFGLSVGGETGALIAESMSAPLKALGVITLSLFTISSIVSFKDGEFVRMTSLMIIFASLSIMLGYGLIGILMTRLAHDVTAFSIYIVHDMKYQEKGGINYFYYLLKIPASYIIFALPVAAMLLSYAVHLADSMLVVIMIALFSFVHYSMEAKVWRRGTPHRETIA